MSVARCTCPCCYKKQGVFELLAASFSDEYVTELASLRKSHKELEKKLREALDELAKMKRQYGIQHRTSYHE